MALAVSANTDIHTDTHTHPHIDTRTHIDTHTNALVTALHPLENTLKVGVVLDFESAPWIRIFGMISGINNR